MNIIAGNVYKNKDIPNANKLSRELRIFPTPFKGIYYVPYETERNDWYVTDPNLVIFKAAQLYINDEECYLGLYSALYYQRIIWNSIGTDIINKKISRKITRTPPSKKYWRGKIINKIMASYAFPIRFHKMKNYSTKGLVKKGLIIYSNKNKTKIDSIYLCNKGNSIACEVKKILEK
jgi:hypothetical protein